MSLLRKTMLGMIGISSIFAANPGAAFAPLGAGMIVIGAAIGIGMFASAAANSIARQPEAAKDISGAVNLPLFLLEGVAIIALVVCILAVVG
jgi:F-type H+-transporting ATPase subunit c